MTGSSPMSFGLTSFSRLNLVNPGYTGLLNQGVMDAAVEFGIRFETDRIVDEVPPTSGKPFETLVPKPDADGLDQGGIALPEVRVPVGTRTGFNTRNDAAGFPWATGRWDGSFVPFPRSELERQASGDPRASIEARYANRGAYEAKVRSAAAEVGKSESPRRVPLGAWLVS